MKEATIAIGEILMKRREQAGLGPTEVAELLGVNRKQIYRYEEDKQNPDIDKLKKLSTIYKCDLFRDISEKYGLPGVSEEAKISSVEKYLNTIQDNLNEFKKTVTGWKVNSDESQKNTRRPPGARGGRRFQE